MSQFNMRPIVDEFITKIETSIRETIMSSLGVNGTYGKPETGRVPSVERDEKKPRKKMVITKARRAQMRLQGQYLGMIRGLNQKDRKAVKTENKKNGVVSALSLAGRLKQKAEKPGKTVKKNGTKKVAE